jgi:hypothetical protein
VLSEGWRARRRSCVGRAAPGGGDEPVGEREDEAAELIFAWIRRVTSCRYAPHGFAELSVVDHERNARSAST